MENQKNIVDTVGEQPDESLRSLENMDSQEPEILSLFTEVYDGYKISSQPFDNKSDAYEEIRNNWQGTPNVTTYYYDKKWYIISK